MTKVLRKNQDLLIQETMPHSSKDKKNYKKIVNYQICVINNEQDIIPVKDQDVM